MSQSSPGVSELDARLAEIDRRLQAIQADLIPEREPPPAAVPADPDPDPDVADPLPGDPVVAPAAPEAASPAPPPDAEEPAAAPRGRSGPLAALLQRSRLRFDLAGDEPPADLVALAQMHDQVLRAMRELIEAYGVTLGRLSSDPGAGGEEVALSAGPFTTTEAVQRFVVELAGMDSVHGVNVRGYEGKNRALLEVQLAVPSA